MTQSITLWSTMTATFFFTISMIWYNAKHLFKQQKAVQGVVLALDNIRYILMFISFIATITLVIHLGISYTENMILTTGEAIILFIFIALFGILASMAISGTLLWTERAIGEGTNGKKLKAILLVFGLVALLDVSSISKGYATVSKELESKLIKELDSTKKDKDTSFIMETRKQVAEDLREQLKDIDFDIKEVDTFAIVPTKRMRELKAQIRRYEKKNQSCPNTRSALENIEKSQRAKRHDLLAAKKEQLQTKLLSITESFESTVTTAKQSKQKQIKAIKEQTKNDTTNAVIVAFLSMIFAISLSVLRSILIEDEVQEEIKEEAPASHKDDKRHYILEAMKDKARRMEMNTERSTEFLSFGRDDMIKKAQYLAGKDSKIIGYDKNEVIPIISDLKKNRGELEQWLNLQSWNMFRDDDPRYEDDFEVGYGDSYAESYTTN